METTVSQARLILASGSPRRRELLAYFGLPFAVIPSDAEENAQGPGLERVAALARLKGTEVARRYPALPVLSADTLVCVDDLVLGKPADAEDAVKMLRLLSGRWHSVYTGTCLRTPDGQLREKVDTTRVKFRTLHAAEIDRYVATGEPMDKAGAYAMQEIGGLFVERIDGSPTNVIGLPLAVVASLLQAAGLYPGDEVLR